MASPAAISIARSVPTPPRDALHWTAVLRAHLTIVRREIEVQRWSEHPYSRHRLKDLQSREANLVADLEAIYALRGGAHS